MKENGYGDFSPFVRNGPKVHEFLREMNREVLAKYDLLTVGECSGVTVEEAKKYANEDGTELDMVFQFEHMDLDGGETFKWNDRKIDLVELKEVLSRWQRELDGKAWNSLYWCNHDQPREDMMRYLQYKSRDNARTPMQWDDTPNGGFTEGTPWIRVNSNYKEINARDQLARKDSVFHYYQQLIRLRKTHEIVVYGEYELLEKKSCWCSVISKKKRNASRFRKAGA